MNLTPALALLAVATATAAAPAQATADAAPKRTYYTQFDVSVQGRMVESWTRNVDREYSCSPREEASGGATITFATPKPYRVTAGVYGGFHGSPLVDVSVDRHGQSRNLDENGNPGACGEAAPDRDGSACGLREFRSRLRLPKTSRFAFGFRGDRFEYDYDCPYPPAPPSLAEDFYESTSLIGEYGSRVGWIKGILGCVPGHKRCVTRRKFTIHHAKHVSFPYGKPEYDGRIQGSYEADIEWTATIRRVGKAHTGP